MLKHFTKKNQENFAFLFLCFFFFFVYFLLDLVSYAGPFLFLLLGTRKQKKREKCILMKKFDIKIIFYF